MTSFFNFDFFSNNFNGNVRRARRVSKGKRGRTCRFEELEGREMLSVTPWSMVEDFTFTEPQSLDYEVVYAQSEDCGSVNAPALAPLAAAPDGYSLPAGFENCDVNDWYALTQIQGLNFNETNTGGGGRIGWEYIGGIWRLTALNVSEMGLTGTLDVSGCTALKWLYVNNNYQLTTVNASDCTALTYFELGGN